LSNLPAFTPDPEDKMTETTTDLLTVKDFLDNLQAERNAEWSEDRLLTHAANRQSLEDRANREGFVKAGDRVEPFELDETDGGKVVLTDLLADGPVVLLFFRFEGCPACNAALQGYQRTLAGPLRQLGAHLVAISPQVVDRLGAIKQRHGLDFIVASDPDAVLIDKFGIGFAPDKASRRQSLADGHDLSAILGTESWTLPYPTAVVIGTDRVVSFADVHPNWMVRTQADVIIDVVRNLTSSADGPQL
jgi:peroxiredoxin